MLPLQTFPVCMLEENWLPERDRSGSLFPEHAVPSDPSQEALAAAVADTIRGADIINAELVLQLRASNAAQKGTQEITAWLSSRPYYPHGRMNDVAHPEPAFLPLLP